MSESNSPGAPPAISLAQLFRALETMQLGVTIKGVDGRLLYVNPAEAQTHGYTVEELVGQAGGVFAQANRRRPMSVDDLKKMKRWNRETENVKKDGSRFRARLLSDVISDTSGEPVAVITTCEDITEKNRAERLLKEREQVAGLRAAVGSILGRGGSVGVTLQACAEALVGHMDVALARFWTVDEGEHALIQRAEAQAPGLVVPRGTYARVPIGRHRVGRIASEGTPYVTDDVPSDPTMSGASWAKEEGLIAFAGYPLRADDHVLGVMALFSRHPFGEGTLQIEALSSVADAIAQYIRRRHSEDALRESEEKYRALFSRESHAITLHDFGTGALLDANEAALALYGYSRSDFGSLSFRDFFGDPDAVDRMLIEAVRGGGVHLAASTQRRKDGSLFPAELTLSSFSWNGRLVISAIQKDLTETLKLKDERERIDSQIRETAKLEGLGLLAGGIAHDFNNLLVGILGNAGLCLLELGDDSPLKPTLEQIERAALKAADLTKQLLAYAGKGRYVVGPVNLSSLVSEIGQLLQTAVSKKAVVSYELASDLPAVEADATQLSQVVMNLLTNAAEAIEEAPGTILIRTYREPAFADSQDREGQAGTAVVLEVTDSGRGMDEATKEKIFEPFFTTKFTGRGLGLSAVLGIVRRHGGRIDVQSGRGQGTTFRIVLPSRSSAPYSALSAEVRPLAARVPTAKAEAPNGPASSPSKQKVLVVDDEPYVREFVSKALTRHGYVAVTAASGADALSLYAERSHELSAAIVDMAMPDLNGETVFREMMRLDPRVPVLMSSGYGAMLSFEEETSTEAGPEAPRPAGFIEKPYQPGLLIERLATVISKLPSL